MNHITKIRFFNVSGSLTSATSWTVYMGSTAKTSFVSNSDWIPVGSLTSVFSGTLTSPAPNTWLEITLTTPFLWDGVSNIVVAVDENQSGWSNLTWRRHNTGSGSNRSLYISRDGSDVDPAAPAGTNNARFDYIPQTQFEHEVAPPCAATPDHATAVTSVSSFCSNSTTAVDLSSTGSTFANGLAYQWQSNNGSGWVDYPAGTTPDFATVPTETVNVRLITTCPATLAADTSEEATITFNQAPTLSLNQTEIAYCSGSPVQIVASGAETYAWTPATGLDVVNNDTVMASPVNATTYSVIGTDLIGCMDTATVLVTPLNKIQRSASY
ncbi:MAG TPA: hypothetical protein V6C65_23065, partial [Allocoleopsis sp.]